MKKYFMYVWDTEFMTLEMVTQWLTSDVIMFKEYGTSFNELGFVEINTDNDFTKLFKKKWSECKSQFSKPENGRLTMMNIKTGTIVTVNLFKIIRGNYEN